MTQPEPTNPPPKGRRRWVFSLRSLLITVIIFCVLLGLYARREPYRSFVKKADEYRCNRHYKFWRMLPMNGLISWCDERIGRGTLQNPCDLSFFESLGDPIHTYSDSEFAWLFKIHSLEVFRADGIYLNDELAAKLLKAHPHLHTLSSQNPELTAKGAAVIATHTNIKSLQLMGDSSLNDEVVREFESMSSLEKLRLQGPSISVNAIQRLRKALPKCKVYGP